MIRLFLVICLIPSVVLAKATNINEVTDLFQRSVENKDQYIGDLEEINIKYREGRAAFAYTGNRKK